MKITLITKSSLVALSVLGLVLGEREASAINSRLEQNVPATSGKPYSIFGTTGQDFSNWQFSNDRVKNTAATTRTWSVPMVSPQFVTGFGTINVRVGARCTAGSFASVVIYDSNGTLRYSNFAVPCSGITSLTELTGPFPHFAFPAAGIAHDITVEYTLAANGSAGMTLASAFSPLALAPPPFEGAPDMAGLTKGVQQWLPRAAVLVTAAAAVAIVARSSARKQTGEDVDRRIAQLASSVERLRLERPTERVIERHTTQEVVTNKEQAAREERDEAPQPNGPFDPKDVQEYAGGRGPHPVERLFEREPAGRGSEVATRQHALEAVTEQALEGLDADLHSVECRSSACRIEGTYGSTEASNNFIMRVLAPNAEGKVAFESGGMYAPVQESVGDRHHTVFYVMKKPPEG